MTEPQNKLNDNNNLEINRFYEDTTNLDDKNNTNYPIKKNRN